MTAFLLSETTHNFEMNFEIASLLGGNFLEILPGNSDALMEAGAVIYDTRDPVSLSDLLGKFIFQGNDDS